MALAEAIPSGSAIASLSGRPQVEAGSEIAWQGAFGIDGFGVGRSVDSLKNAQDLERVTSLFQAVNIDRRPLEAVQRYVFSLCGPTRH